MPIALRLHAPARSTIGKQPPPSIIESALKSTRLYHGSMGVTTIRNQQKLYRIMVRKLQGIADRTGMSFEDVSDQISREAERRGPLRPIPGQHI